MLLFSSISGIFQHSNIVGTQRFLCCINSRNVWNRVFENLVTILSAAAHLLTEPRYAPTLRFQIGLNLVSYVYIHKKGVNYPLKSLPCPLVPPSNPNQ